MTERAEEADDKPAATHNCEAGWEIWAHSRTWNPARQTSLSPSLFLSVSPSASNHVTQPQRNASYIGDRFKTSVKEKERIAEGSIEAVGAVCFLSVCIKGQHWQYCKGSLQWHTSPDTYAHLLHTCLHKLNQRRDAQLCAPTGEHYTFPLYFSMPLIKIDIVLFQYVLLEFREHLEIHHFMSF